MLTSDELKLVIELANRAQVQGLEAMNAILSLAGKCQSLLQTPPAEAPPAQ